jgi:hypothetical protein
LRWPNDQVLSVRRMGRRGREAQLVGNALGGRTSGEGAEGDQPASLGPGTPLRVDCPTLARAAAKLADENGRPRSQVERELLAFCAKLAERGLIELRTEPAGRVAG